MFNFNKVTRVLRNVEQAGEAPASVAGSHLDFNPSTVSQGVGVFDDMKADAQAKQAREEETGSVSPVSTDEPVLDVPSKDEPVAIDGVKDSEVAAEESAETIAKDEDGGLSYKGVPVTVTNTPEMVESFKEKGLDIDAVNAELYSKDGITEETRNSLNEAFGKVSVDMYLEGLTSKNDAMVTAHNDSQAKADASMDAITLEATGGKFDEVMKWANDNLDDKQYASYAEIINGTNEFQVKLALKDLTAQSGIQSNTLDQPAVAPRVVDSVLSADVVTKSKASGEISSVEYRAAHTSGEYKKNMNDWDRRRQAGIDAGIA
tara:strand:+ start:29941 stop:30894 length:954 start_codon:yes stop_codon:yes gene_type:complete